MNFFKALFAKLTGGADAPKTLDQARATFGEAKSALEKIGALFSTAALDLDALLAKGDTALKDYIAELNEKAVTAEAALAKANDKITADGLELVSAKSQIKNLESEIALGNGLLASIGYKPAAGVAPTAEAVQAAWKNHISGAVTQQLQEIGQPIAKLPTPLTGEAANTALELRAEYARLVATGDATAAGSFWARNVEKMYPKGGSN